MIYTVAEVKEDLAELNVKDFYKKYLLRSDNWYFEKILNYDEKDVIHAVDDFRMIVSDSLNLAFNNVMMVGSAKTGMSIAPKKLFKEFVNEGNDASDIDIAIVSPWLFEYYWKLFRKSYDVTNERHYRYITRAIYRGYISDMNLLNIKECSQDWKNRSRETTNKLRRNMYFKHEIHYRIYRDWSDMEEYHLQSIEEAKGWLSKNG